MVIAPALARVKRSLLDSSGTIVFGMEDGTVSIFGLVFGVAATTFSSAAFIIAGASGAAAAAVSMMAGAYLEAETTRDTSRTRIAKPGPELRSDVGTLKALLMSGGIMDAARRLLFRSHPNPAI